MELFAAIDGRRSVRSFTDEEVPGEVVRQILLAGSRAPSGLNNQPWRFVTVRDRAVREELAGLTKYGRIVRAAPLLVAVFLDPDAMYDATKDRLAVGACLQNMLLAVHALGYGAVWLGEILKNSAGVRRVLGLEGELELMALLAIGRPAGQGGRRTGRLPLRRLLVKEL
jgi:nitroreductase